MAEEIAGGVVQRRYTHGRLRISQTAGAATSYYGYDDGGSVRQLFDNAGVTSDTYSYDAYGNVNSQTGSTVNAYMYRGEQLDTGLGMYYLRARWYRSETGRFLTADTFEGVVGYTKSHHQYGYAEGDPIKNLDPSGHGLIGTAKLYAYIGLSTIYINLPRLAILSARLVECAVAAAVVLNVWTDFLESGMYMRGFNMAYGVAQKLNPVTAEVEETKKYVALYGLGSRFDTNTANAVANATAFGEVIVSDSIHSEGQIINKVSELGEGWSLNTCASKTIPCGPGNQNCSGQLVGLGLQQPPITWTRWKIPTCFTR